MMRIVNYPEPSTWASLLERPVQDIMSLLEVVRPIYERIKSDGDRAVYEYEEQFDHVRLTQLAVSETELVAAGNSLPASLREAIDIAYENIHAFHAAQRFEPIRLEVCPGVVCEQRAVPIERVGLYVPGGTAPLFSTVLMLAVPAQIAGCREIVLTTPPGKDGHVHPAILYAAHKAGVHKVFTVGGAQAVASMAVGTESIPKVDKIFGPGNQYVMAAKQLVALYDTAIDLPAGPSEVEVLADETSCPEFVAADLLSQAEHGVDSQVVLVTTSPALIEAVQTEVERQLSALSRREIARKALDHSLLLLVHDMEEAIALTNAYAPEHLILAVSNYNDVKERIDHAGSVFLGNWSCESAGDYASGTNHTLPTKGYARAYSGLCLDSFMRKMTLQELTPEGIHRIGPAVEQMAEAECLDAHRMAMTLRRRSVEEDAAL